MTTIQLYRKHKAGEISKEKFLYEVRRDNNLPFITNLTSYDDAVKILKNKGIVTDETPVIVGIPAVGLMAEAKETKIELTLDTVNPYEYRHGLQYELAELDDYSNEALEKAKATVLKNLNKDANFYSTLLNQKQSSFEFKKTETDAKGMQAKADGHLKKELKKDEKANVQDSLGKKEAGKKKPKGIKIMPDKGVTGSEKTIKEGLEVKQDNDQIEISDEGGDYVGFIENGKVTFSVIVKTRDYVDIDDDNWKSVLGPGHAFTKIIDAIGGDVSTEKDYVQITVDADKLLNTNIKEELKETKKNKYIDVDEDGTEMLNKEAVTNYLKSVIDPEYAEAVDSFMSDSEGWEESEMYFFEVPEDPEATEKDVEEWAKQEMSYYLFSKPDEFPVKENLEEIMPGVDLGASFEKMKGGMNAEDEFESLVKKYDWYAEMSDDSRKWDAQQAMEAKLRQLAKTIGIDKAVEIFNRYAPSDRKVTSSDSMWMNEDKHAKIKEALKKALKEEDPALSKLEKDEEAAEKTLASILTKKAAVLSKPGTQQ